MSSNISNVGPNPDNVLTDIADHVVDYRINSREAYKNPYTEAGRSAAAFPGGAL